jgi:hypothetical protein
VAGVLQHPARIACALICFSTELARRREGTVFLPFIFFACISGRGYRVGGTPRNQKLAGRGFQRLQSIGNKGAVRHGLALFPYFFIYFLGV